MAFQSPDGTKTAVVIDQQDFHHTEYSGPGKKIFPIKDIAILNSLELKEAGETMANHYKKLWIPRNYFVDGAEKDNQKINGYQIHFINSEKEPKYNINKSSDDDENIATVHDCWIPEDVFDVLTQKYKWTVK